MMLADWDLIPLVTGCVYVLFTPLRLCVFTAKLLKYALLFLLQRAWRAVFAAAGFAWERWVRYVPGARAAVAVARVAYAGQRSCWSGMCNSVL